MPSPSTTKSETRLRRGRSRSRSRSRGRSKSPSRKAKQSPSPSRKVEKKTTSPSRKPSKTESSPSRTKVKVLEQQEVQQSRTKVNVVEQQAVQQSRTKVKVEEQQTVILSTEQKSTSSSVTSVKSSSVTEQKALTPGTRHSARIAEKVLKHEGGEGDSIRTSVKVTKSESIHSKGKHYEMGGPITSFIMILFFPLLTFSVMFVCNKSSCSVSSFMNLPKLVPRNLSAYYDRNAVLAYLGFLAFQAFLFILPVGRVIEGPPIKGGRLTYRLNGFFMFVVNMALFVTMWRYKCGVTMFYRKYQQLAATGLVLSFFAGVLLYLKGRNLKPSQRFEGGHSGCLSHDFIVGRELNPRIGSFDIKMFFVKTICITLVLMAWTFVVESYEQKNQLTNMPLLLSAVLTTIYCLDFLVFEQTILTSATVYHDAVGAFFVLMEFVLAPFFYTVQQKYLLEHPQNVNNLWLAFYATLFAVGYFIRRGSDSQKNKFRTNPHDPSIANLETMPTTGGKKLLVSGWWGLVRHPNYLGELIMYLAMYLPLGCGSCIPYLPLFLTVIVLMGRAHEDSNWCRQKHGAAWERYCQRVKYAIVPYVY